MATHPHVHGKTFQGHGNSTTWHGSCTNQPRLLCHMAMATLQGHGLPLGHGNSTKRPWQHFQTAMATRPNGHGNSTKRPWQLYKTAMATLPNGHGNTTKRPWQPCQPTPNGHGNPTKRPWQHYQTAMATLPIYTKWPWQLYQTAMATLQNYSKWRLHLVAVITPKPLPGAQTYNNTHTHAQNVTTHRGANSTALFCLDTCGRGTNKLMHAHMYTKTRMLSYTYLVSANTCTCTHTCLPAAHTHTCPQHTQTRLPAVHTQTHTCSHTRTW